MGDRVVRALANHRLQVLQALISVACLDLDRKTCRTYAEGYSWRACAEAFIENLQPLPAPARKRFWQKLRLRRRKKPLELVIPPVLNMDISSRKDDDKDEKKGD